MKQTENNQTVPTSTTHQDEVNGATTPVRKRNRRRRLPGW